MDTKWTEIKLSAVGRPGGFVGMGGDGGCKGKKGKRKSLSMTMTSGIKLANYIVRNLGAVPEALENASDVSMSGASLSIGRQLVSRCVLRTRVSKNALNCHISPLPNIHELWPFSFSQKNPLQITKVGLPK